MTTAVRAKVTPSAPARPTPAPVAEPVRRATSREPVPEEAWVEYEADSDLRFVPMPGGCLVIGGGGRGGW